MKGSSEINYEYEFGEIVYILSDDSNSKMIVTGYLLEPVDQLLYRITGSVGTLYVYGFEISGTKSL